MTYNGRYAIKPNQTKSSSPDICGVTIRNEHGEPKSDFG